MTMSFASRAAAKKLLLIIALILIPAVFFGGIFTRQALQDISLLKREVRGLELAELVFPALENNSAASVKDNLAAIQELESSLGITGDASLSAHLEKPPARNNAENTREHEHVEGELQGYIADIASVSGIILDSDAESYHLANMLLINLPIVWKDAAKFETLYLDPKPQLSMLTELSVVIGNLGGAFDRQKDALNRALESSDQAQKYSMLTASLERLEENVAELSANITGLQPVTNRTKIIGLTSGVRRLSHASVGPSFSILKARLDARKGKLESLLLVLLATGVTTVVIAAYLAARLVSTTFKKLDAVEEAHRVSEVMRQDTDRINGEVADLNRNLAESLEKLQTAQHELLIKGKLEQLGQLTATVAHEIRNPLGSVRTSAFLIGRKVDAKAVGIEQQLDRINKGVDRCDSIITQLLDFSRTKQVSALPSQLDDWLETLLREESESLPPDVTLECHLGLGNLEVNFDQARMRRAVCNVLQNASEAMVGKGGNNELQSRNKPLIRIETKSQSGHVEIVVRDNGPGMTADVLAKIREPLFTTKNFGTGLGIPAVEQIVKQHGGELMIQSEQGKGAEFTIRIPIFHTRSEAA